MKNPATTGNIGGGGCGQTTDTLVPDLPFDFLQPPMRKGVTQVGYGGPFVIRSNPIGAFIDTIRNFCFPVPMQQTSTGYEDLSGTGLGSYGTDTSSYLGYDGYYGGGAGGLGYTPFFGGQNTCGAGTMYDTTTGVCVPSTPATTPPSATVTPPATTPMCDDPNYIQMVGLTEGNAYANHDVMSMCGAQAQINACISASTVPLYQARWSALAARVKTHLIRSGCNDCASCAGNSAAPTMMGPMGPTGDLAGESQPNYTPGQRRKTSVSSAAVGGTTPTATPAPPVGGVPQTGLLGAAARLRFPRLPSVPSPMSLTEGNVMMLPSAEPMGGMFDPFTSIPQPTAVRNTGQATRLSLQRGFNRAMNSRVRGR